MSDLRGLRVKPGPGTLSAITGSITTNCLRVTTTPTVPFWHYDVAFLDSDVRAGTKWNIIDALQHQNTVIFTPRAVYDGNKNLYSLHELQLGRVDFTVTLAYPRREFHVAIKLANVIQPIDLNRTASGGGNIDQRLMGINLMNVLVRMYPVTRAGVTAKGRGFYTDLNRKQDREVGALEFWRGFISSVRPGVQHYLINIDASVMPMYPDAMLLDALVFMTRLDVRGLSRVKEASLNARRLQSVIRRYCKGLRVRLAHRKGTVVKKISDFAWKSATEYTFDLGDQETSVRDYFHQQGQPLRYPDLPILAMIGKKAALPLEFLRIVPGQPYRGVVPESQTKTLLNFATQKPQDRLANLRGSIQSLGLDHLPSGQHRSEYLSQAGVNANTTFMNIQARVLPAPILWTATQPLNHDQTTGAWNMLRHRVVRAAEIDVIAFLIASKPRDRKKLQDSLDAMVGTWQDMGIGVNKGVHKMYADVDSYPSLQRELGNILNTLKDQVPKSKVLVVVIVQDSAKALREGTKWWGDVYVGLPTQVLKESKLVTRGPDQYARNVGLKINAKMNGINVISTSLAQSIMQDSPLIIGLDTSHPSSGSNFPTTAAMVYSIDADITDYRSRVKFQHPRQELITGLSKWILDALQEHCKTEKKSGKFAKRVIVYRDGVSEGQFQQVLGTEVKEVLAALRQMGAQLIPKGLIKAVPKLTFIVVGKKHHVRFFPTPGSNMADRKDNAVPGTIIDTEITTPEPNVFDFYLQSHGSLLGTSRPAHYSVLYDDSGLTSDELEKFSHDLCHIYQIATRSVSIPAPVYYADKLAGRSSIFFHNVMTNSDAASVLSDDMTFDRWSEYFDDVKPHEHAQRRMYWL